MTSALFGVSDTPWCLCQPIISFWPAPWCFKLMTSFVNCPEPVVGARVCTQMTIIENSQSTIHLLQKGTSWAYWDPLRPSLDGFHRIVGFFVIHQLFLWPLIPLVSFCQLFKSPLVVQCCNVICEWPLSNFRLLQIRNKYNAMFQIFWIIEFTNQKLNIWNVLWLVCQHLRF